MRAPAGSVLNARPGAAVAAGNVETSSRVADMVLSAFGRAQGQGTMNNLSLGDERFSYYETLGGGQGACADADGPSGVHVAMSNTLNTPIEALEREFPLRVIEYSLRRGSGGAGRHRGGDGVVRELEALSEMSFSLIAERRRHGPRGAAGGGDGRPGRDPLDGAAAARQGGGHARGRLAASHRNPRWGRIRDVMTRRLSGSGSSGSGSWARGWPRTSRAPGTSCPSGRTRPARRRRGPRTRRATAFATPAEVAAASDVVFSMVVDGEQVASVLLGDGGAIEAARDGLLCVDCSTIAPGDTRASGRRWPSAARACSTRPSRAPRRAPRTAR